MKKWVFLKKYLIHRKNASKVMVWVKSSYQEDPIAVIFVVVAWPEVAYEIDSDKKSSSDRKNGEIKKHKLLKSSLECSPGVPRSADRSVSSS